MGFFLLQNEACRTDFSLFFLGLAWQRLEGYVKLHFICDKYALRSFLVGFSTGDFPTGHVAHAVWFLDSICWTCHEDKALSFSPVCVLLEKKKKLKIFKSLA